MNTKNPLNPQKFPHLSQWEANHLNETLESLTRTANPNKETITEADKMWSATMLEMDLAHQNSTIWEEEETDQELELLQIHNRKMTKYEKWFKEWKVDKLAIAWDFEREQMDDRAEIRIPILEQMIFSRTGITAEEVFYHIEQMPPYEED